MTHPPRSRSEWQRAVNDHPFDPPRARRMLRTGGGSVLVVEQ
ncbi:MAG: hypothetical protein RQ833_11685 [Sphingomonadaceae bacterium]|nr:hypothetical protein [Sphingomonadaceae bacterium]